MNVAACRADCVPILRRASGGASIVTGRGCLMYAAVLSYRLRPELRSLDATHRLALDTLSAALEPFAAGIARRGTSDAAWGERKISGNSVRCKRHALLYHGTLLYDFPLELRGPLSGPAPARARLSPGRAHADFVANLPADPAQLRAALARAWHAGKPPLDWPRELVAQLVAEKYGRDDWNSRH